MTERIAPMLPTEQIATRVRELGADITRDYAGRNLVLVCVLKGSFVFGADLARAIDLPLRIDFLGVRSYGEGTESSGVVQITQDLSRPIEHEDVLLVVDIVDTGVSIAHLMDLLRTRAPASVRVCALLHKPARARVQVAIDYLGFTIEDRFVVELRAGLRGTLPKSALYRRRRTVIGPPRIRSGALTHQVGARGMLEAKLVRLACPSKRGRDAISANATIILVAHSPFADEKFFHALLTKAVAGKASDVHIKVGQPPGARIRGDMIYFRTERITPDDTVAVARLIISKPEVAGRLDELKEYDTSYSAVGIGRFRVNVYRQRGSLAVVMRFIPTEIPKLETLGLPTVTRELAERQNGMVLVVGAAGNGKSTSIASMVAHLNATRALHIVTVEDPIEFLHRDELSSVSQREVGLDTASFAAALRAALRQDPDVIFVGEIRDEETMDIALKAAETGHVVMATLHTSDAVRTVNRMLALMHGDASENRARIASCLQGIVAQRLLPRADGSGVVLAAEVLVASQSVKESIRRPENNPALKSLMEKGMHPYGMQTFQMSIGKLLEKGVVDEATANEALGT